MRIAEATASDIEAILSVERAAFGEDGAEEVATLVSDLADDPSAHPSLSLLAWEGERPVGHILFTAARLEGAPEDVVVSILAPLAVVPEAQRKGVGGRLIAHGIQRLCESGVALVFVLGHPEYYPRHGFAPAHLEGLLAPYPISPEDAWMVRELRHGVLGSVRGTVVCAQAMDRPEYWRE
jgi:putative acetyltransferase